MDEQFKLLISVLNQIEKQMSQMSLTLLAFAQSESQIYKISTSLAQLVMIEQSRLALEKNMTPEIVNALIAALTALTALVNADVGDQAALSTAQAALAALQATDAALQDPALVSASNAAIAAANAVIPAAPAPTPAPVTPPVGAP